MGELGWHMDIPKKSVGMEEVNTVHALYKARSGTKEESGLVFFFFFSHRLLHLCYKLL
jgi:hypothetical protein